LDGYTATVQDEKITLRTADVSIVELEPNVLEQMLSILTNPNVIFLLLAIGAQAILIEISQPGGWVAGFFGAVCLALAFYGLGVLPVNWFGLVFIILAFVLFIMDITAPTHGALTAAATGSLIVGALVLFNSPGSLPYLQVSVPLVILTSLVLGGSFFGLLLFALRTRNLPPQTGVETLVGKIGYVTQTLNPRGIVQVESEDWSAESVGGTIAIGESVVVVEVRGVRLRVRKQ
jgi:membrane-bound serine protease (ClpP class)